MYFYRNTDVGKHFKMKTIRLILTFYKSFAFVSFLITFICLGLISGFIIVGGPKGISLIQILYWFKIFTLAITVYTINVYKKNEFYYYKNLGLSKFKLWIPIITFDFLFFLITIIFLASYLHETFPGS